MESKKMIVGSSKFDDDERVYPDYEGIIRRIAKKGLTKASVSRAIGMTSGYICAMATKNSKMTYGNLKRIAKVLGVHGATKLIAQVDENNNPAIDKEFIEELRANTPVDERIAEALEAIASILIEMLEKK